MTVKHHRAATVDSPRKTVEREAPFTHKKRLNESKIAYKRLGGGRRVFVEQLRLAVTLALTGCTLIAIETTPPGVIDLPGLSAAAPSLGLLFAMAVGFLWREEEGAIAGLVTGWLADATAGGGMMLSPLLYFLCGYLTGLVGRRRLAHNLPSFVVFSVVGGGVEAVFTVLREMVLGHGLPPFYWTVRGVVPVWLLTVLLSPVVYGVLWLERRMVSGREH